MRNTVESLREHAREAFEATPREAEDARFHLRQLLQYLTLAEETTVETDETVQWCNGAGDTRYTLKSQWDGLVWILTEETMQMGEWTFEGCEPVQMATKPEPTEVSTDVGV